MAKTVYIVSAVRTPIGKFGGMLADFTHPDLGTIAVRAALERAFGLPLPAARTPGEFTYPPATQAARELPRVEDNEIRWHVDEVIFGNARPAGVGPNPARQVAWRAGLAPAHPIAVLARWRHGTCGWNRGILQAGR